MATLTAPAPSPAQITLYTDVADRVTALITAGTLRPGARIPSVRKLSRQFKVSISTVLQAYRLLEDRGHVEAKPQSGYYVKSRFWQRPPEPERTQPPKRTTKVTIGDMATRVLQEARRPGIVMLGAALSGSDVLPVRQLNRIAAAVGRRSPKAGATYDVPPGCEMLRVQIARRALDAGITVSPDHVVTTSGCQEAIALCLRAVTKPGDTVAVESPTFYGILQLLELLGLRALEIPTDPRTGVCLSALQGLLDANKSVRACLFVNNFNNPLGSLVPDDDKRKLVELLAAREIPLIEDDIYGELGFAPARPSAAKAYDKTGNVLLCSSFSKTIAPGYRVGWCLPGKHQAQFERAKLFSNIATATIPQLAIAEYLAAGGYDHHLRRIRRTYQQQIARMSDAVQEYFPAGTKLTRPQGGFVLWVELPAGVDTLALHDRALEHNISIAPGPIFSPSGKYANCLRLNCEAEWSDTLERAIETLGKLTS
ncbi:MAG TPA: PLP-dependent aminotransferase family protein [Tepidisphaeraceae bacterium]|nr:PLP-dependent aminotransferase family protein [Tepidisphaeraceae bacterium]